MWRRSLRRGDFTSNTSVVHERLNRSWVSSPSAAFPTAVGGLFGYSRLVSMRWHGTCDRSPRKQSPQAVAPVDKGAIQPARIQYIRSGGSVTRIDCGPNRWWNSGAQGTVATFPALLTTSP